MFEVSVETMEMSMTTRCEWLLVVAAATLAAPRAYTQEDGADQGVETLDVTMTLMPEGATLPDAVTRVLELPEAAAETARDSAAHGLETANQARGNAPALGEGGDARENGREFGQEVREQAQQNREDVGRGSPETAGPPDVPGPPEKSPGPPGN
jgi:hypothetical protein